MTQQRALSVLLGLALAAGAAWGQQQQREPHIGYAWPAGGQQGATVRVMVGGQYLRATEGVHVTGGGVEARVLGHYRVSRPLSEREQRYQVMEKLRTLCLRQWEELYTSGQFKSPPPERLKRPMDWLRGKPKSDEKGKKSATRKQGQAEKGGRGAIAKEANATAPAPDQADSMQAALPEHPFLVGVEDMSLWELGHARTMIFFDYKKKQSNAQIGEVSLIELRIAPDAEPGDRELRLEGRAGLTNPVVFQVGTFPEAQEYEPNDPNERRTQAFPDPPPLEPPVVVNGQIMPGDVDRIAFRARKGQRLTIDAEARRLVPFLADAVPGWFQAVLAVYGPDGKEIAYADDYYYHPDPVLFCEIPADGVYQLEIRDSIYRGREDFVYRVRIADVPFATRVFPLGAQEGKPARAVAAGWNMPDTPFALDTSAGGGHIRRAMLPKGGEVLYAVDDLPDCTETEPNDDPQGAQRIEMPAVVNGRVGKAGDADVFAFAGRAGQAVVCEVTARRLRSPLDSVVHLMDSQGKAVAWNDDYVDKRGHLHRSMGYQTHGADSYLMANLPADGTYYVRIADTRRHGGEEFAYRLRISPPRPDFTLVVSPSCVNLRRGASTPVTVHALRRDGFDGDIEVRLADAPGGLRLDGACIPGGRESVRMTVLLAYDRDASKERVTLKPRFEGIGRLGDREIVRPAAPCDDVMQAFLWRHLAPTQEFVACAAGRGGLPLRPVGRTALQVPAGGEAELRVHAPRSKWWKNIELKLDGAPEGLSLAEVVEVPEGLALKVRADGEKAKAGLRDNLIVEVIREVEWKKKGEEGKTETRRVSAGVLPAIPVEVVAR